jgi:succinoglycan biosynthesis transport protein ExoP
MASDSAVREFDIGQCVTALLRYWWIILLGMILGVGASFGFLSRKQSYYVAQAVLFMEEKDVNVMNEDKAGETGYDTYEMILTTVDTLNSRMFAVQVAEAMNISQDKRYRAHEVEAWKYKNNKNAGQILMDRTDVVYREGTRLIDIRAKHPDATLAKDIANTFAREYVEMDQEKRSANTKKVNTYLLQEAERLGNEMRVAEEAMQAFRERERSVSLDTMQTSANTSLADVTTKLNTAEEQAKALERDLQRVQESLGDEEALLRIPSVAAQPEVANLSDAIVRQEEEFTVLKRRYKHKHPTYIAAETRLNHLKEERRRVLSDIATVLTNSKQEYQRTTKELQQDRALQENRLLSVTSKTVEFNELKRELDTSSALYDSVLNRLKELDLAKGLRNSLVSLHEPADTAKEVKVDRKVAMVVGSMGGMMLGLCLALGLQFLDKTIPTVADAEKITGITVLTQVPKTRKRNKADVLTTVNDRDGIAAEAFRTLRTTVGLLQHDPNAGGEPHTETILLTSSVPGEGKTYCACNFAASLSQQGLRTLLIDADLRRPAASYVFFPTIPPFGMSDLLAGKTQPDMGIHRTAVENLDILPAGSRAMHPAELFTNPDLPALIRRLGKDYDRVVIDSAPILAVSDPLLLAVHVDLVLMVLWAGKTPRSATLRAITECRNVGKQPVGLIMNQVSKRSGGYNYSGRYYQAYQGKKRFGIPVP